jgi:L-alanine-DL-glutamate epimerase-like enolase superfamily enzyme
MIELYRKWAATYPIVSIEDGLDENDWPGFTKMTSALGDHLQIVGDDIFVTNPVFVRRGISEKAANAVLIKLNQIGTVTETIQTGDLCRAAGWRFIISHRAPIWLSSNRNDVIGPYKCGESIRLGLGHPDLLQCALSLCLLGLRQLVQ